MGGPRKLRTFEAWIREKAQAPTPLTVKHVAEEVGIAYPTAIQYIDRLQQEGKLKVRRQGRRRIFHYTGAEERPETERREAGAAQAVRPLETPGRAELPDLETALGTLQEITVRVSLLLQTLASENRYLRRENEQLRSVVDTMRHVLRKGGGAAVASGA